MFDAWGSGDHCASRLFGPLWGGVERKSTVAGTAIGGERGDRVLPYPPTQPGSPTIIDRRLQVHDADIDPDLNAGAALYFVEGEYITDDDAAAGNDNNNASYRTVNVTENVTNIVPTRDPDRFDSSN